MQNSKYYLSVFIFFLSSIVFLSASRADENIFGKIPGIKKINLTDEEKTRALMLFKKIKNTHGCLDTIETCIKKSSKTAIRHAGFIVRMIKKRKDDKFIKEGIKLREKSARPQKTQKIDLKNHPFLGNSGAKVIIVEYACFECPYCSHLAPKLKKLIKKFPGKIAHYYKFFPVRSHKRGVASALAGLAAFKQGKFWQMYSLMFAGRHDLEDEDLEKYAKKAGLDIARFKKDLTDEQSMRYVEKDKLEGMRIGVDGTPTFYINNKLFLGSADYEELVDRIEEELENL